MLTDTIVRSGEKVVIWTGTVVFNLQQWHSFLYPYQTLHFLVDSSSLSAASGANVNDACHHTSHYLFFYMLFNSAAKCEDYIASVTE
jgi:hypothetical protein